MGKISIIRLSVEWEIVHVEAKKDIAFHKGARYRGANAKFQLFLE